jgi:dolichyl-phosphate-mannose-protein mannosyltransferase
MHATKSSKTSPISKPASAPARPSAFVLAAVMLWLPALSAGAVWWFFKQGQLLWYGDATAHLNIARSIIDSRTPGLDQLGASWLPLTHLLMLPFVKDNHLWQSGLAGAIPSALCFVLAGALLFCSARRLFASEAAGVAAVATFVLNPNMLYLQAIPMTESIWFAALAGVLYCTVRFGERPSVIWSALAGVAALAATQIRYDGWFIVPLVYVYLLVRGGLASALVFGAIAIIGPISWLAHNWWYTGDALAFYHGPYSAKAIGARGPHPGYGNWRVAFYYVSEAARLCAGTPLFWIGLAGAIIALVRRVFWPVILLIAPAVFYLWSMYASAAPIHMPHAWPFTYYNTRYGTALMPLLALGGAVIVSVLPKRFQPVAAVAIVVAAIVPWAIDHRPDDWAVWKESQVNSESRRAWTRLAAGFLRAEVKPHDSVLIGFGDQTGILQQSGIPLRRTLYDGNNPHWLAALARPDLFLREDWAVAIAGDAVSKTLAKPGASYRLVKRITVRGAPPLEIYQRQHSIPY